MASGNHAAMPETSLPEGDAVDLPLHADVAREEVIDKLLERVDHPLPDEAPVAPAHAVGLRTARIERVAGRLATIVWRGQSAKIKAEIADEVDLALVKRAVEKGEAVLVEVAPGAAPVIVGIVQTRLPSHVELRGETITIDAEREVLFRAGRAAVRLREDGDIEVVGSRIAAMSRGLFRIVGRVLRLN